MLAAGSKKKHKASILVQKMVFQKKCVADSYDICCTNLDPTQMSGLNSGSLQIGDGESSSRSPGVWWGGGRYGCVFFVPTCVKEEYLVWSWICGPGLVFFWWKLCVLVIPQWWVYPAFLKLRKRCNMWEVWWWQRPLWLRCRWLWLHGMKSLFRLCFIYECMPCPA